MSNLLSHAFQSLSSVYWLYGNYFQLYNELIVFKCNIYYWGTVYYLRPCSLVLNTFKVWEPITRLWKDRITRELPLVWENVGIWSGGKWANGSKVDKKQNFKKAENVDEILNLESYGSPSSVFLYLVSGEEKQNVWLNYMVVINGVNFVTL